MINKLAIVAAVLVTSIVPAFAQSFAGWYGTGNVLSSYFDQSGSLHEGVAPPELEKIAAQRARAPSLWFHRATEASRSHPLSQRLWFSELFDKQRNWVRITSQMLSPVMTSTMSTGTA